MKFALKKLKYVIPATVVSECVEENTAQAGSAVDVSSIVDQIYVNPRP